MQPVTGETKFNNHFAVYYQGPTKRKTVI